MWAIFWLHMCMVVVTPSDELNVWWLHYTHRDELTVTSHFNSNVTCNVFTVRRLHCKPLNQHMLPVMRQIAGSTYMFQQDSTPTQWARDIAQLLQQDTPQFIAPDLWPPNSPDLNPVDYCIWGVMQERVYKTPVSDTADIKQHSTDRLRWSQRRWSDSCVKALATSHCERKGRHFEHTM